MRKDIEISEVTDLEMAVVLEPNETHDSDDWYVYLINKKNVDLDMVIIVSQGFSETKTTTVFRKKIDKLPTNSFVKVEMIHPDVFSLDNRFQVSFFEGNQIFEKTFQFDKNTIKEGNLRMISLLNKRGIVVK
ncbi:hypothetical protein EV195_10743 [Tenacibaculum skagerrakense]|uniref:Phenylalanyl-tRNA synthetase subunit alpha n=1 Tax=Tenacibaculum skagerrakense TaxID=186571 RepID=A0A4R2NR65_9FLAO|nr:hypothetical protein [Tenacibaculum skagerrakense]TCP23878.1 hypothetical protein EV195_10743 [Tenacibaculum skagerrakense]